jgi:hypothetical protein
MLQGLAGEPEVLNPVTMLSTVGPNLCGQAAEDVSSDAIYWKKGPACEAAKGGEPPLADSRIFSDLRAESQFCEGYRRNENRLACGQCRDISRRQGTPLHVDPNAGIH